MANSIIVTLADSGASTGVLSANLIKVVANGTRSDVLSISKGARLRKITVTQTPAQIAALADFLVPFTDFNDATTIYVNVTRVLSIDVYSTGSQLKMDSGYLPYDVFVVGAPAAVQALINIEESQESITTGITAHAGGGQGSATALTANYNNVTVVATAADSVKLLIAAPGIIQTVKNNGAANLAVFPGTSGTIDGGSANASVTLIPGETRSFTAIDTTDWESNRVVASVNIFSSTTSITAHAGGGQGSAVALTTDFNNITTCATAGDSVKLLAAIAGTVQVVKNNGATTLAVFPNTGGTINGGSANASVSILPGNSVTFSAINSTDWEADQLVINPSSTFTSTTTITAHAGGGQGSAVALTSFLNTITTCATAGDSVLLPVSVAGLLVEIQNNGAAAADVFPATGGTINGGGANAAVRLNAGDRKYFASTAANTWITATVKSTGDGTVALPSFTFDSQADMGIYKISSTQLGFAVSGALTTLIGTGGILTDAVKARVEPGTVGAGTVVASTTGDGRDFTTVLTLTNFIVGTQAGAAAALGLGNKIYTFPAGAHCHMVTYMSVGLTGVGTAATPKIGIGSVVASGAVAVLNGTATFMDYITEQTAANITGTATVKQAVATAGALTGISLNAAGSVKDVFLNAAATWAADNTGNLTATGQITFKWTKLS